ncbi:hypothetical protein AVEN_11455-1 [Araneus ventricosus]|uniref:Uncharacterized protein n=1 Tax=Araneus ventricosus TaxID=182803 RepID=A0A4Y2Q9S4_ARAVE|nr:hypothetical protein AVEN_93049-1 [Araneus ventricosus]GBN60918.1 hypothetical protein AVEN_11455-1 [Araneus ventricosus]
MPVSGLEGHGFEIRFHQRIVGYLRMVHLHPYGSNIPYMYNAPGSGGKSAKHPKVPENGSGTAITTYISEEQKQNLEVSKAFRMNKKRA